MQFQLMCHGHTQTGKMTWARYHNSRYPRGCCHPLVRRSILASLLLCLGKSLWCLCLSGVSHRWHRILNPHPLQMQGGSDQTLNFPFPRLELFEIHTGAKLAKLESYPETLVTSTCCQQQMVQAVQTTLVVCWSCLSSSDQEGLIAASSQDGHQQSGMPVEPSGMSKPHWSSWLIVARCWRWILRFNYSLRTRMSF